jgi:hypothetical protein
MLIYNIIFPVLFKIIFLSLKTFYILSIIKLKTIHGTLHHRVVKGNCLINSFYKFKITFLIFSFNNIDIRISYNVIFL